jgi:hypothetical protein
MPRKPSISKKPVARKKQQRASIAKPQASGMVDGSWPFHFPQTRTVLNYQGYDRNFHDNVSESDNDVIISRARNLYHNLGAVYNCVQEQAEFSLGEGWDAEFAGTDTEFGKITAEWLNNNWYEIADVRGQPWTLKRDLKVATISAIRDGDCLAVLTNDNSGLFPRIQWIEGHNIGSRKSGIIESGPFRGYASLNGVIYSKAGSVIGYNILGSADDGSEDQQVSVVDSQLVYDPSAFSQGRGLSGIAAGIPDLDHYKTIKEFELAAIKAQGDKTFAVTLPAEELDTGEFDENYTQSGSVVTGIQREVLQGSQTVLLKAGTNSKFENLTGNRPGPNTQQFLVEHALENAFAALRWPLASFTINKSAPTKLAVIRAQRRVNEIQMGIIYPVWKRIINYAVAKAIKSKILPYSDDWYKWRPTWPKDLVFDAFKDVKSDLELYKLGVITGTQMASALGLNYKDNIDQKIDEIAYINEKSAEKNVNPNMVLQLTPNLNVAPEPEEKPSNPEQQPQ